MAEKKQLDLSFLRPSYVTVDLPSRGKFYKHIPELAEGKVRIRPFTSVEEKLTDNFIGSSSDTYYGTVDEMISNCIAGDVDVDDLTQGDRLFILSNIRVLSYGSTYEVVHKCDNCNTEYPITVDLSKFDITYLNDDVKEPFEFELPECKATVKMHMPRSGDVKESVDRSYSEKKKGGVFIDSTVYLNALCCDEFIFPESSVDAGYVLHNDRPDEFRIILGIMQRLHVNDTRAIEQVFLKYDHGILDPVILTCPVCKSTFNQYFTLPWYFFRPRNNRRQDTEFLQIDDDVFFGKSDKPNRKRATGLSEVRPIQLVGDANTDVQAETEIHKDNK